MSKALKLLMISGDRTVLRPGGVQKRLLDLSQRLNELQVIVPAANHKQQINTNAWVYGSGGGNKITHWFKLVALGSRLVKDRGLNVVTAQDPFALGLAAFIIARRTKTKLHLQDHGAFLGNVLFSKISLIRRLQSWLGKWLVKKAAAIRTVSQRGAEGLIKAGVDKNRITVAPIGTDINKYVSLASSRLYRPKLKNILAVGRLEPEKGFDLLLKSLAVVVKNYQDLKLTIVGNGSCREELVHLAKSLKLDTNIIWAGQQLDLIPYYQQADILVIPSYTEGWGLVAIEGAAAGVPIVMTDVGCAGELLKNNQQAIITTPGSYVSLAEGLNKLIGDVGLRQQLGQAAARLVIIMPSAEDLLDKTVDSYYQTLL